VPKKFAPDKIRVNSIHPGLILTPMLGVVTREELQPLIDATPLKSVRSFWPATKLPLSPAPSLSWTAATPPNRNLALVAHYSLRDFDAAELKDAEAVELKRYRLISAGR
jgi:NAD(P)-dependent dehydrogenase (short-subunit alcohol dehydrogenase family)